MKTIQNSLIILLLVAFCSATILPPVAMAASPLEILGQSLTNNNDSSFNLWNVFVGLLLGKILGNNSASPQTTNSTNIKDILSTLSGKSSTTANNAADKSTAIISTAKKYMGVPYVWGGETPDGFDCSGFTQYVMKQNGIDLPRTAAEQYAVGTPVDKSNLQTGDLIFFTTYKPGASHVGFYIGNGRFIHASSAAAKVTISNLNDTFYTEHYIGARRYTN